MIKAITGTKDILPKEITKWKYLEKVVKDIFENFNYKEIRTPIFEETSLFARGIGEETDIVGKEMYTFSDKGGTSVTLRPEMTASVVRAFIEHSLGKLSTLNKLYYLAPMFRQERPQAGRQRQFHQFGAEAIGSISPALDAEMIIMAFSILKNLGLKDLQVKLNSLGVPESREAYKEKLKEYLSDKKDDLTEDSRRRYDKNILRIFDSKAENDIEIMKGAPLLVDYLDDESKKDFDVVKNLLEKSDILYELDYKLVRGLDYYTKTTFEIISGKVGAQSALCGGGRYDLLTKELGGMDTPGVGFAAGIERILLACENENSFDNEEEKIDLYAINMDKEIFGELYNLSYQLRLLNFKVELDYNNRSVKAQMREANKINAKHTMFFGGEEYKDGKIVLKNMSNGEQILINKDDINAIAEILKK